MGRNNKKRSQSEQQETLSHTVNMSGEGEDPAVKALLQDLPTATNLEGLEIALGIQELLRGQRAQGEELAKVREEMARLDAAAKKWEEDRTKFAQQIFDQAEKLRMSEAQREQLKAREGINLQEATAKARAEMVMDRKRFDEMVDSEPKEIVSSPGRYVTTSDGKGMQMARLLPEEIRIKHRVWVLQPHVPTEVPRSVAQHLRDKHKSEAETQARQKALMSNLESAQLDQEMARIDAEFNSSTERL